MSLVNNADRRRHPTYFGFGIMVSRCIVSVSCCIAWCVCTCGGAKYIGIALYRVGIALYRVVSRYALCCSGSVECSNGVVMGLITDFHQGSRLVFGLENPEACNLIAHLALLF